MVREVDVSYEVQFKNVDSTERPVSLASAVEPTGPTTSSSSRRRTTCSRSGRSVGRREVPLDRFSSVEVHLRHRDEANGIDEQDLVG